MNRTRRLSHCLISFRPANATSTDIFVFPPAVLAPSHGSAAVSRKCGSIYRGFSQCLLALGDSMSESLQRGEDTQEIDSVCR